MLHPKYEIKIGSVAFEPESSNEITDLTVSSSMNFPSDTFEGTFRSDGQARDIKNKEILELSLGYEDGMSLVFQGIIQNLTFRTFDMNVTAYSGTFNLTRLRIDKFYEQRTAGQIVKDLADNASVETLEIEDGVKFPYYAIDSNKNAYEHIKELSVICGYDIYCNPNNKLVFKKYNPSLKHSIQYGKNLIRLSLDSLSNPYEGVKVIGESPSSEIGPETSHWLKKEQVYSSAGSQESPMTIVNRAVKDEDTARRIAEERLNTVKSQQIVAMDVVGSPEIVLGDAITIEGVPNKLLNGEYQVKTVRHSFSKRKGFISTITCRGTSRE